MAPLTFRQAFKLWLYGHCPGFAGAFPYYGTTIHFPKGSILFEEACRQGIFEHENVRLMLALAQPGTTIFDIGCNIGLMSVPLLTEKKTCRVVSFEPSPNVLPYLQKTVAESPYSNRWTLIPKAAGPKPGRLTFHLSDPAHSAYDGTQPTQRIPSLRQVEVEVTTVDQVWHDLKKPRLSLIKCDVEGAELGVLMGAHDCLKAEKPSVLLEWNATNLAAHQCAPDALLGFARDAGYRLYAVPNLVEIERPQQLTLQMSLTESFLLHPEESDGRNDGRK